MFYNDTIKIEHVKNLHRDGDQVFWSYDGDDYMTNNDGEGIWKWSYAGAWRYPDGHTEAVYEWKQITGTCQFSLHGMSMSGIRKKLNRTFNYACLGICIIRK